MALVDRLHLAVPALGVVLLVVSACGPGHPDDAAVVASASAPSDSTSLPRTTSRPSTTTRRPPTMSIPPAPSTTVPAEPLRVLLVGDSLMFDVGPAALETLDSAVEPVEARYELLASMPRTDDQTLWWRTLVEGFDPDVVVVFIGIWEGMVAFGADVPPVGEPGFEDRYRRAVLAPWFDHLGELGARTIFVGSAPMKQPDAHTRIQLTVDAAEVEAASRDGVDFVRTDRVLGDDGAFVEVLSDPRTGAPERIRRAAHLCVDGVERVVGLILERLHLIVDLTIGDEWRDGRWRTEDLPYDPVQACPPA